MKATIAIAALGVALTAAGAQAQSRSPASQPFVTHYGAQEGFYHVVGDKRFVGYFVQRKGACSLNLLIGSADERDGRVGPINLSVDVEPSQSLVMQAGKRQSLDIACGAKAGDLAIHTGDGSRDSLAQTD